MNVASLLTLLTGGNVERNFLAFFQGFETISLNRGKVCEEIFTTLIRGNKAKALGIVKPLDCTCCHILNLRKLTGPKPKDVANIKTAR